MHSILRDYTFSCLYVLIIWVLCLMPVPETPLDNVSFIDKWTHFVMFVGLTFVIWVEYVRKHRRTGFSWSAVIICGALLPAVMGGVVELAQAFLTSYRSGDWLDVLADVVGVVIGMCAGVVAKLIFVR